MTPVTNSMRAGGLAAALLAGALLTGACGGGGHGGTAGGSATATTAPAAATAVAPGPDVDAELQAVDDGLQRLDGNLNDAGNGLATDEGDPSQ